MARLPGVRRRRSTATIDEARIARRDRLGVEIAGNDHRRREDSAPAVPQESRGEAESPPEEVLEDAQARAVKQELYAARITPASRKLAAGSPRLQSWEDVT